MGWSGPLSHALVWLTIALLVALPQTAGSGLPNGSCGPRHRQRDSGQLHVWSTCWGWQCSARRASRPGGGSRAAALRPRGASEGPGGCPVDWRNRIASQVMLLAIYRSRRRRSWLAFGRLGERWVRPKRRPLVSAFRSGNRRLGISFSWRRWCQLAAGNAAASPPPGDSRGFSDPFRRNLRSASVLPKLAAALPAGEFQRSVRSARLVLGRWVEPHWNLDLAWSGGAVAAAMLRRTPWTGEREDAAAETQPLRNRRAKAV